MPRWPRVEIEEAFDKYREATRKAGITGEWRDWADCFTEDVTFIEHGNGNMWGRERVYDYVMNLMKDYPLDHMDAFPVPWYSIDEEKGWIFCSVINRMRDLGDGKIYEEENITILHYAGDGLFSYEEDAYNPKIFEDMINEWLEAKEKIESETGKV